MPSTTRSGLIAAEIYEVDQSGNRKGGGVSVFCMFNPNEYSISKTNNFEEKPANKSSTPHAEFKKAGPQALKLNLIFDTYELAANVALETNKLWKFMEPSQQTGSGNNSKSSPPQVAFEWGVFKFVSFITSMTQKFTLFLNDGTPVRAQIDATFTQYTDLNDYPAQNPTSGNGPLERVWMVKAGDRMDNIAYTVYGDATKWRYIAIHNGMRSPLEIRPGQYLNIPQLD